MNKVLNRTFLYGFISGILILCFLTYGYHFALSRLNSKTDDKKLQELITTQANQINSLTTEKDQVTQHDRQMRDSLSGQYIRINTLTLQRDSMSQMLTDRYLTALTSFVPVYNPNIAGIPYEFDWYPAVPAGFELVMFNGDKCFPYDAKNPPAVIVPIEKDQVSYTPRVPFGSFVCVQIWKNYKKGIVSSNPVSNGSHAYPNTRAID